MNNLPLLKVNKSKQQHMQGYFNNKRGNRLNVYYKGETIGVYYHLSTPKLLFLPF